MGHLHDAQRWPPLVSITAQALPTTVSYFDLSTMLGMSQIPKLVVTKPPLIKNKTPFPKCHHRLSLICSLKFQKILRQEMSSLPVSTHNGYWNTLRKMAYLERLYTLCSAYFCSAISGIVRGKWRMDGCRPWILVPQCFAVGRNSIWELSGGYLRPW